MSGEMEFATRAYELRTKLENVPLSVFTAGDLPALHRVLALGGRMNADYGDLDRLEKVLTRSK